MTKRWINMIYGDACLLKMAVKRKKAPRVIQKYRM